MSKANKGYVFFGEIKEMRHLSGKKGVCPYAWMLAGNNATAVKAYDPKQARKKLKKSFSVYIRSQLDSVKNKKKINAPIKIYFQLMIIQDGHYLIRNRNN